MPHPTFEADFFFAILKKDFSSIVFSLKYAKTSLFAGK